jgi:hypothetical protein
MQPGFLHYGLRVALIAVALILWFWTQVLIARKTAHQDGLGDASHDWTAPLLLICPSQDEIQTHPRNFVSACPDPAGLLIKSIPGRDNRF